MKLHIECSKTFNTCNGLKAIETLDPAAQVPCPQIDLYKNDKQNKATPFCYTDFSSVIDRYSFSFFNTIIMTLSKGPQSVMLGKLWKNSLKLD